MAYDKEVRQYYLALHQGRQCSCEIGNLEQIVSLARRVETPAQG